MKQQIDRKKIFLDLEDSFKDAARVWANPMYPGPVAVQQFSKEARKISAPLFRKLHEK